MWTQTRIAPAGATFPVDEQAGSTIDDRWDEAQLSLFKLMERCEGAPDRNLRALAEARFRRGFAWFDEAKQARAKANLGVNGDPGAAGIDACLRRVNDSAKAAHSLLDHSARMCIPDWIAADEALEARLQGKSGRELRELREIAAKFDFQTWENPSQALVGLKVDLAAFGQRASHAMTPMALAQPSALARVARSAGATPVPASLGPGGDVTHAPARQAVIQQIGSWVKADLPDDSWTREAAALNCDHCDVKRLDGMIRAQDPETKKEILRWLSSRLTPAAIEMLNGQKWTHVLDGADALSPESRLVLARSIADTIVGAQGHHGPSTALMRSMVLCAVDPDLDPHGRQRWHPLPPAVLSVERANRLRREAKHLSFDSQALRDKLGQAFDNSFTPLECFSDMVIAYLWRSEGMARYVESQCRELLGPRVQPRESGRFIPNGSPAPSASAAAPHRSPPAR